MATMIQSALRQGRPAEPEARDELPLREVLDDLWRNTDTLIRQEFDLASAELDRKLDRGKKDAAAAAVGGAVLYGGVLCLLAAVALLLSQEMKSWVATLVVAIAAMAAGAGLLFKARKDATPARLTPHRTVRTIKEDVRTIKEAKQ